MRISLFNNTLGVRIEEIEDRNPLSEGPFREFTMHFFAHKSRGVRISVFVLGRPVLVTCSQVKDPREKPSRSAHAPA